MATSFANTKNDLVIAYVQKELIAASKLAGLMTDISAFATKGSKSAKVPKLGSFTVANRTMGSPGSTQTLTDGFDTVNFDENAFISYVIDSSDSYQTPIDVELEYAARAARAHGKYFDTVAYSKMVSGAGFIVNATPAHITNDAVLDMIEFIENNDGDLDQSYFLASPAEKKALMKLDQFSKAEVYGAPVIKDGLKALGTLYGIPLYISSSVPAPVGAGAGIGQVFLLEKNGLGYGFQKEPAMDEQKAVNYGVGSKLIAVDQLFGIGAMETNIKGLGVGASALIAKLNGAV